MLIRSSPSNVSAFFSFFSASRRSSSSDPSKSSSLSLSSIGNAYWRPFIQHAWTHCFVSSAQAAAKMFIASLMTFFLMYPMSILSLSMMA